MLEKGLKHFSPLADSPTASQHFCNQRFRSWIDVDGDDDYDDDNHDDDDHDV